MALGVYNIGLEWHVQNAKCRVRSLGVATVESLYNNCMIKDTLL